MAKKGQTYRWYSLELKLEAARLVNEEHMSIREVAKRLGIQIKSQVQVCNRKLKQLGMLGSYSRRGNCLDNACIESFFSHLKTEKIYLNEAANKAEVEQASE
ncbi:hypothetical protein SAMN04488688_10752 [Paenibacillus sp. cl141a]|nr:hypothetical protein [Paenibacillus sp. cl141a]SEL94174.1 hypothetical protein SAMN04488688_10752 [Paenibacillus sp. cl141a]